MPEVTHSTVVGVPRDAVWAFVKDMDNWAPMLTGYQKHVRESDTDSVWTLKGDVGILARVVELAAHVTEWCGPERVSFTLTGQNEPVEGGGTLTLEPCEPSAPAAAPRMGPFARLLAWLFALLHGKVARPALAEAPREATRLTFTLRMDAGGAMGPLVNAMLAPAMSPACADLAEKIAAHLEQTHRPH